MVDEVQGVNQSQRSYTRVRVTDKDSKKSFVIDFANSKIKGNVAEWTIKDGKVYDKNGKTVKDNEIEVTKYQAALIKAAAEGDGNGKRLDSNDLVGAIYGEAAEAELQKAKSEYHVAKDTYNNPPALFGVADAMEHGVIFAEVENAKGDKGHLKIQLDDYQKY